jgi:beta-phosphoglucomutase-like phosphatase (HAD superfamily)
LAGKPEPDMFLAAAQQLGVQAKRSIVVEDAIAGVQAGKRGGFISLKINVLEMVEAAGVEPASENVTGQETTCLVQFLLPAFTGNVRGRRSERTRNAFR